VGFVKSDATVVIQVKGVEDAVKGLEAPGVQIRLRGSGLQGAFVILAQEDAGCAPIMVGVGNYRGVCNLSTWSVWVIFFLVVEPKVGLAVGGRHVGENQVYVVENIVHLGQIHPGAVNTAGSSAFGEITTLDRLRVFHAGVEAESFGHGGDCNIA